MNKNNYTLLGIAILSFAVVLLSVFLLLFLSEDPEFSEKNPFFSSQYISERSNDIATNVITEHQVPVGEDINPAKQGEIVLDENRKVVSFRRDLTEDEKSDMEEKYGVSFTKEESRGGVYSVITDEESDLDSFSQTEGIESVEVDVPVKISGDTVDWGIRRIGADKVWDVSSGSGLTVAIVDTGIQLDHPDLQANVVEGYDFVNERESAMDDHGHGTHVAGIVAAVQNQIGTIGASHGARLMPVKVLNSTGSGYVSDVAKGIHWATDNGAQIINLSLGTTVDTDVLRRAVNYASSRGVLLVGAAGNNAGSPCNYPGAYSAVICVVATDSGNKLASFSNVGGELAAPGVSNYSTFINSTYRFLSGTSMASPHVAGSLAVIAEACPDCSASELRNTLRETAIDLGEEGYDIIFGYGLVDLVTAIEVLVPEEELDEEEEIPEEEREEREVEDIPEEGREEREEQEGVEQPPAREVPRTVRETPMPTTPSRRDFVRQRPVITEPSKNGSGRFSMTTIEDVKIEFTLEPTTTNSGFEKTVVYLNNEEVYTTTNSTDSYILEYDGFEGIQQFVRITSFFRDGTQGHDQIIIDRAQLMRLRPTGNIIQRGRRVLGISSGFSLLDFLR